MKFIWDEVKRQSNLKKHAIDFVNAEKVFTGSTFTFEDNREDYGEQRWVTLGLLGMRYESCCYRTYRNRRRNPYYFHA
jgi:uncharacterized DUF497 family protein